jgi:hypothetical protein
MQIFKGGIQMNDDLMQKFNNEKNRKLRYCVMIDLIGYVSFLIPGLGEFGDIIWAPISGYLIYLLFPNRRKMAIMGAIEEAIPFLDLLPTALMTWRQEYVRDKDITLSRFIENEVREQEIIRETLNRIEN